MADTSGFDHWLKVIPIETEDKPLGVSGYMPDYSTTDTAIAQKPSAGEIQARVDLRQLARVLLGKALPGGDAAVYLIPQFNPDYIEYHVFKDYFRNPVTGDRGSAILFVQRLKACSYDNALAYLQGWLDGVGAAQ